MRRIVLLLVATVVMVAMAASSALSQPIPPSCGGLNKANAQVLFHNADWATLVVEDQRRDQGCVILT